MEIFDDLKFRGLIFQITNEKGLKQKLKQKIVLYCGFDPTASSFHIGNLLPILTLRRFQIFGHRPIVLIGGATALIGDPSGKERERPQIAKEKIDQWKENLKSQLEKFLDFGSKRNPAKILDNYQWLSKINLIDFLRNYGKHFQVSQMIAKESVKRRISTTGISFSEFSYMALQALDFLELKKRENCDLQIGGSDQWGNITSGVDLIKKVLGIEVFGFTLPLILAKSGKKFGKTEKGTIFLDKNLTTPYQFYQFWFNVPDEDAVSFLKYFTFLKKEEILDLEKKIKQRPREAQKVLAKEMTKLVHGEDEARKSERISKILFYGNFEKLKEDEIKQALFEASTTKIKIKKEISILELLILSKASKSKTEAKRLIKQKGILINGKPSFEINKKFTQKDALYQKYFIIKRGKRNYYLVECQK